MTDMAPFDPYALLAALDRERVTYVVIGGFARVVHGSGETTRGLDIVPSLREENLRRLGKALDALGADPASVAPEQVAGNEMVTAETEAGSLTIVPTPWGTRGYDDIRIRAFRENLGRGVRAPTASVADCVRMLAASERELDAERLERMRRMMELERQLVPQRGLSIER